jgi:hypothetical protein
VTIFEKFVYGHRWWHRNPRLVLRVVLAIVSLVGLILGSGAGTDWE